MIIYTHHSIVNKQNKYRVFLNGDKIGEFDTNEEAQELYNFWLLTQSKLFKNAILDAFIEGKISTLKPTFVDPIDYYNQNYAK